MLQKCLTTTDGSSDEILSEASDEMFIEYVSAFVRLIKKGKNPYGDFYNAIERDIYSRPEKIQKRAREILNSV